MTAPKAAESFRGKATEYVLELLFRPFGACSRTRYLPTACAVGCILLPLSRLIIVDLFYIC